MEIHDYVLISLVSLALVALIVLIFIVTKRKEVKIEQKVDLEMHEKIFNLNRQLEDLNKDLRHQIQLTLADNSKKALESDAEKSKKLGEQIENKLKELNNSVNQALVGANKVQGENLTNLGKQIEALNSANKEVSKLGESVGQLTQVISGNNIKRGKFGEFLLEAILDNIFESTPDMYKTQQTFTIQGDMIRPDAVIYLPRTKGNMLLIDAKFPYANYLEIFNEDGTINEDRLRLFKNDVKDAIEEIAKKYIIKELTTDYALCYFPSDEIYNFIHVNLFDIAEMARKKNVILVSPATLQPVLHTLRNLMIEYKRSQKLQELNKQIASLANDFRLLNERWGNLNGSLSALNNHVINFDKTFRRLDGKFTKISDVAEIEEEE